MHTKRVWVPIEQPGENKEPSPDMAQNEREFL